MSKTYAQIESTLPHSKKLRQLTHQERWAYLCAHLTPLGGFIGLFRYPKSVWADDADLTVSELDSAIEKMATVGLLSFDEESNTVRITGWFLKKNAPENASRMASIAADFSDLDAPDDMVLDAAAEFTVGSIKRAQRWNSESTEWAKLRGVFKPFLAVMRQNFEDDFHDALAVQLVGQNRAVKAELCGLMPSLQFHLEAPCPHPADTVGAHDTRRDETDTTRTKDLDENYTAQFSGENVQPFTSAHSADVGNAEKSSKTPGPRPDTIAAARRIGAIQ
ncbi:hypothetical protein [Sulfitobacter mediterraneus]|uniref:hypothetical protein n=1 Tax=Sulfitobacter mediterraneus TaxID=83219 RepID=UPI0021A6C90D|nr:hypothetical protein [Sulfitobacter mediterraneus]UWR10949.1 hypothetical protein K3753_17120 [Sulfitobacter mediterraneus]